MPIPVELDPDVDDAAPTGHDITPYDERHYVTYLRLLDAKADGADWREVAHIVLHRDPAGDEARTRRCWETDQQLHLQTHLLLLKQIQKRTGLVGPESFAQAQPLNAAPKIEVP